MKDKTNHRWLLVIAVTAASVISAQASVQLAVNGGFQTGDTTGWTSIPSVGSTFTVTSPGALSTVAGLVTNATLASSAVIKQDAVGAGLLGPGGVVTIRFDLMESSAAGGVIVAELFSLNSSGGVTNSQILGGGPLFGGNGVFKSYEFTPTLGLDVSGGLTLQFAFSTGAASGSTVSGTLDNVSITVVPEPSSVALLGLGSVALLARRRRQA